MPGGSSSDDDVEGRWTQPLLSPSKPGKRSNLFNYLLAIKLTWGGEPAERPHGKGNLCTAKKMFSVPPPKHDDREIIPLFESSLYNFVKSFMTIEN